MSFNEKMEIVYQNLEFLKKKASIDNGEDITDKKIVDNSNVPGNFITYLKPNTLNEKRLAALKHLHNICEYLGSDLFSVFDPNLSSRLETSTSLNKSLAKDIQTIKYVGKYYVYFVLHYPGLKNPERIQEGELLVQADMTAKLDLGHGEVFEGTLEKSNSRGNAHLHMCSKKSRESVHITFLHYPESNTSFIGGLSFIQRINLYPFKHIPLFQMMIISSTSMKDVDSDLMKHFLKFRSSESSFQLALLKKYDHEVYSYIKHMLKETASHILLYNKENNQISQKEIDVTLNQFDIELVEEVIHTVS